MIASPFFFLGLACSILLTEGAVLEHLAMGTMTVGIAFLAALILLVFDCYRDLRRRRNVRRQFASREDVDDAKLVAELDLKDRDLAVHLRGRLAQFFELPAAKIRLHDDLDLLAFRAFWPMLYFHVMSELCDQNRIQEIGRFPKTELKTVRDLISEAKELLKEQPPIEVG